MIQAIASRPLEEQKEIQERLLRELLLNSGSDNLASTEGIRRTKEVEAVPGVLGKVSRKGHVP